MCTRPQTMYSETAGKEITFSCRTCDECVAVRRHNWVSRAMAEKSCHPQSFVVALTYSDESQFTRDGAAFFRYNDVRLFLARLRDQIRQATGKVAALRFIAAGEQGSRSGRCHWHIVLFSDVDLLSIGEFRAPWGVVTAKKDIVAPVGVDMPRSWTMWPHGFCQVQEPDEGGMHYAMSYALKDQFNVSNSRDSKRISRAEEFATGLFRMSKQPPIGAGFIDELIYEMYTRGFVLPKLQLQVPGLSGYWYPGGTMRKRLLEGIKRVNDGLFVQYDRNASQWSSLVNSLVDNEGDLEILGLNIPEENPDEETLAAEISLRGREANQARKDRDIASQCGGTYPCVLCLRGFSSETLEKDYGLAFQGQTLVFAKTGAVFERPHKVWGSINPKCQLAASASRKRVFSQSAG